MDTRREPAVLAPDLTAKVHPISVCSGQRVFVVEAYCTGQSADPAQPCHCVSLELVLTLWGFDGKAEIFKWKEKGNPFS